MKVQELLQLKESEIAGDYDPLEMIEDAYKKLIANESVEVTGPSWDKHEKKYIISISYAPPFDITSMIDTNMMQDKELQDKLFGRMKKASHRFQDITYDLLKKLFAKENFIGYRVYGSKRPGIHKSLLFQSADEVPTDEVEIGFYFVDGYTDY